MRLPLSILGLLTAVTAIAATPQEVATQAIGTLMPKLEVGAVQESPLPGFYEAMAGGQFFYVSKDGRYLLDGNAYDVAGKRDLTAKSRARANKSALDKIGPDKRIVFAPPAPAQTRHAVTVFTDIDCPFCRRFHQQIAAYNAKGIAVEYLFNALVIHPSADEKAEAVWCAKDRPAAFTAAMGGQDPGKATCPNPVAELTRLAQSLGINGTPTILAADGSQIPIQIAQSPDQLAAELDRRVQNSAANAPPQAQPVDATPDVAARKALQALVPQASIDTVEAAPMPGYRQLIVGSQMVYVSDDGLYLMQGSLHDTRNRRDLTVARVAERSKTRLDAAPAGQRIVFPAAGGKAKYTMTVFTDLDCGYCRKLHSQIAEYNQRGIEVDYLFFPRSGLNTPSYDKAVSVWCAKDRKAAFTAAKTGKDPAPMKCDNPVADQFKLGTDIGVDRTPTIFTADGTKIIGYLPPDQMVAKLQSLGGAGEAR
ncbi:DsbC family protein [Dokdonella sp.]|uniref:DsbC family protein n=1 Tax=Dokdonella sp. TaxID=2291710 RepID=UPI001B01A281|nr:DsbC family protein [Dokdonella sp.]MBO9661704.1 DsbC family protein [Dokdonella sp.]